MFRSGEKKNEKNDNFTKKELKVAKSIVSHRVCGEMQPPAPRIFHPKKEHIEQRRCPVGSNDGARPHGAPFLRACFVDKSFVKKSHAQGKESWFVPDKGESLPRASTMTLALT